MGGGHGFDDDDDEEGGLGGRRQGATFDSGLSGRIDKISLSA